MMRTSVTVNVGTPQTSLRESATNVVELLDIADWVDDYAIDEHGADAVLVRFDVDLPDLTRLMTTSWLLVQVGMFDGVELTALYHDGVPRLKATFGHVPEPFAAPEFAFDDNWELDQTRMMF